MKKFNTLVFIGRFQPFHIGHASVIDAALKQAEHVIVLVGSSSEPRNIRNPWTFEERKKMILGHFSNDNLFVKPLLDYPYDDNKWMAAVQSTVYSTIPYTPDPMKIGLIGHNKDHTSYYLNMFPSWDSIPVPNYKNLNATEYRKTIFEKGVPCIFSHNALNKSITNLPASTKSVIYDVSRMEEWKKLEYEYKLINEYKKSWESAPYAPTFVTVDSVVIQSGHILLVKRKSAPGIGQWALPGGFLNQHETMLDGALRELKEETKLKVPVKVMKGSIEGFKIFDAPHRSTRGRTITMAYFFNLEDGKLPKVTGADDAEKAVWVPFKDVKREMMFEDHFHIIDYFTNIG